MTNSEHLGIRLRLSIKGAGPILDADSMRLHLIAKYSGPSVCTPACLPGCQDHGWYEVIPGREMPFTRAGDLKVEIMPVMLSDALTDDD